MITGQSQRDRLNNPAIGPMVLSPTQAAFKNPMTRLGREDPEVGQSVRVYVQHDPSTGDTMVSDTDPLPDGWVPEAGGVPSPTGMWPAS